MREAIKTLEQKQTDWNNAVKAAGRGISADEQATLTAKAKAFNDALIDAKTALARVDGLSDKATFENKIKGFGSDKTAPTVNDGTNGQPNDIPDSVDNAMAKLTVAETAKNALDQAKNGKSAPYSGPDAKAINEKVNAFNAALDEATEAVNAATDKLPNDGDRLNSRLTALGPKQDPVETNDKNANGNPDAEDIEAVNAAIRTLTEKRDAWETAKNQAGRAISTDEKTNINAAAKEFNDALDQANTTLTRVANLAEEAGLKQRVADFGDKKALIEANDTISPNGFNIYGYDNNANDVPDPVDRALQLIRQAKDTKDNLPHSGVKPEGYSYSNEEVTNANKFIDYFNDQLRNAREAVRVAKADSIPSDMLDEKLQELGNEMAHVSPENTYPDNNHNGKDDNKEFAELSNLVEAARNAEAEFNRIKQGIGNAVNQSEYDQLKAASDKYNAEISKAKAIHDSFPESSNMKAEMGKVMNRVISYPKLELDMPPINDRNNNDIPDDQEAVNKAKEIDNGEGRNTRGGSLAVKEGFSYTGKLVFNDSATGKMFNSIRIDSGSTHWPLAEKFKISKLGDDWIGVSAKNENVSNHMKVSEHFGYTQYRPGVNSAMNFSTGNKNDMLLIGGNASGGQHRAEYKHRIDLKGGDDVMIVGAGNSELRVGVVKTGEDLGRTVAKINGGFDRNTIEEVSLNDDHYYANWEGYLAGFHSINLGSGNDAFIVRGNIYKANIYLDSGDDDAFLGGTFEYAQISGGIGKDHIEITAIGTQATVSSGEDNDIVTVHRIEAGDISLDLGSGDDKLILKTSGVIPTMNDHNINGSAGTDTIVMDIDRDHANNNHGLTSKDFQGFERIVMKQPGFLQIRSEDFLKPMDLTEGKKVIRVENESGVDATVNLGDVLFPDAHLVRSSLTDRGGVWNNTGTHQYEGKEYTVYSYSHNGTEAEVWFHGGHFNIL